jgi:hypothetical protein
VNWWRPHPFFALHLQWTRWLEIGIQDLNSNESTILLLKPDGCEAYRLPGVLPGELEGLMVH